MTVRGLFSVGRMAANPTDVYSSIPQTPEDEISGVHRYRRTDGETLVLETLTLPELPPDSHPSLLNLKRSAESCDREILRILTIRRTIAAELRHRAAHPEALPPTHAEECVYDGGGVWRCATNCRVDRP